MLKNELPAMPKQQFLFKAHKLQVVAFALLLSLTAPKCEAKGLFGSDDKDASAPVTLQAQLYQIQQQLTQLQAQMTQLQLQMNKRTTVIEQKQNSLHETLTQQQAVLKTLAREEQQMEHQVQINQAQSHEAPRHPEPVAVKAPLPKTQQPSLEESADYEVAKINTKAAPAYKSHIQDLEPAETQAPTTAKKSAPLAIAAKPAAPNTVAETKKAAAKKQEEKQAEEKTEPVKSTGRLLPGFFGDRLSKAKKETPAAAQAQSEFPVQSQRSLNSGKPRVKATITIKAPPEVVWDAVHEQRKTDPELAYSKVLKQGVNESTLEQKFTVIPMIGTAVCVMNTQEVPNRRIDYQMVKSDKFKALEGSWVLIPSPDGKSTTLELSSHVDLGLPVPRGMMNGVTQKKLERRLAHVRELAEKSRLAQRGGAQAQ